MAAIGLEGGLVGSGGTCGIISGGAIGIALMHEELLDIAGLPAKIAILDVVRQYVKSFRRQFGDTACRHRTGVDFRTLQGQLRYFLSPNRLLGCFAAIGAAAMNLYDIGHKFPVLYENDPPITPVHCAREVLAGIRAATGVGDPKLESLSFVFDGGIGLSGGLCGALAGAVMAANLKFGVNSRGIDPVTSIRTFFVGHGNLVFRHSRRMPEPFGIGKAIVSDFSKAAGPKTDCTTLAGRSFPDAASLWYHLAHTTRCQTVIDNAIAAGTRVIETWNNEGKHADQTRIGSPDPGATEPRPGK